MAYEDVEQAMQDAASAADATNSQYGDTAVAIASFGQAAIEIFSAVSGVQNQVQLLNLDPNDTTVLSILDSTSQAYSMLQQSVSMMSSALQFVYQMNGSLTVASSLLTAASTMLASIDPDNPPPEARRRAPKK